MPLLTHIYQFSHRGSDTRGPSARPSFPDRLNDLVTDGPEILWKMSGVRSPYSRSGWYNAAAFDHKISHVFLREGRGKARDAQ